MFLSVTKLHSGVIVQQISSATAQPVGLEKIKRWVGLIRQCWGSRALLVEALLNTKLQAR